LINEKIIDQGEGQRIINKIQNTNDITGYLYMRNHADNHAASQEMNNIYMKNKNDPKIHYIFDENAENKEGFSLGGLKNLIMDSPDLKEDEMTDTQFEQIKKMKENLDAFSLTNTGICNALIFLDEKNNINDEYENYNFNPWKCEWIYTPEYKRKRKQMIHDIRSSMDYRGEISDEEDSVIKFEDKREFINQKIKLMNEQVLGKRSLSENKFNDTHSVKIIKNDELILENTKMNTSTISSNPKDLKQNDTKLEVNNIKSNVLKDNVKNSDVNTSETKLLNNVNLFPKNIDNKK
jgi:hypothetical protein